MNAQLSKTQLKTRGWTDTHIDRLLTEAPTTTVTRTVAGYQRAVTVYDITLIEQLETTDTKLAARLAQVATRKDAVKAARAVDGRVTFTKDEGEWVIMGVGLVEGDTVTVTRRDGSTEQKMVGRIVGERDGLTLAYPETPPTASTPRARKTTQAPREAAWIDWDGNTITTTVKPGQCEVCRRRTTVGLIVDMSGLAGWACRSCTDHASFN